MLFKEPPTEEQQKKNDPIENEFINLKKNLKETFYALEMLTSIAKSPSRKISEKEKAIHYMFLLGINCYDI